MIFWKICYEKMMIFWIEFCCFVFMFVELILELVEFCEVFVIVNDIFGFSYSKLYGEKFYNIIKFCYNE